MAVEGKVEGGGYTFIDITKYDKCKNSDTEFRPRTSMHKISVVIPNLMFRVLVPMPV